MPDALECSLEGQCSLPYLDEELELVVGSEELGSALEIPTPVQIHVKYNGHRGSYGLFLRNGPSRYVPYIVPPSQDRKEVEIKPVW